MVKISNNNNITFCAKQIPDNVANTMQTRLLEAKNVDIFCHLGPDEDTFNSAKTMANWLTSIGKKVSIIVDGNLKGLLLKGLDRKAKIVDPSANADINIGDLVLVVDCNARPRLSKKANTILSQYQPKDVIGFDHHRPEVEKLLIGNTDLDSENPFYIDTVAKSCSSIIYRLFEKIGIDLNVDNLENLYCGMVDDLTKFGCVKITNKNGESVLERTSELANHPLSEEILDKIEKKLSSAQKSEVIKHLDFLHNLSPEEKAFQKELFSDKVHFTPNGKLAYVVLDPEDEQWKAIGQDNIITSTILSNFRQRLLANNPADELISDELRKKVEKAKGVIVFYRGEKKPNTKDEIYKMSIHSKDGFATQLVDYITQNLYPGLKAGGHLDRKGGRINSIRPERCESFISYFLTAAENV